VSYKNNHDIRWKADREARKRLNAKGTRDPRERYNPLRPEHYDEIRRYDSLVAAEVVKILNEGSIPALPDNSKPRKSWADEAYG
jgi:hypothetical protein